ncbi:hypothetical protein FFWV33_19000 [Flavobacterium faecale]|uniref:Lipopolysaccharide core biosynthesis protein rfaS n=1 Tax=Flavobacterium faecale TaxID=1355330 RepID=A0A2S1LI47_9FLAO|nr:hypothetical protein [Flavobacterium faecale]AWG23470.1 hypothetical protein FFWV33_19000 [Flavobacterium faecale]
MKICLISFDFYGFDYNIIKELRRRGIDAQHIDISKFRYTYPSTAAKCSNFFNKLVLNKNVKNIAMEEHILEELDKLGPQDIILSIRPDRICKSVHLQIKAKCKKYICYLYDSSNLFPIKNITTAIFDKIYTFDKDDAAKYGFESICNYIYLDKTEICPKKTFGNDLYIVSAIDERVTLLNKIAAICTKQEIPFKFVLVGKKKPNNLHPGIQYTTENISLQHLIPELDDSKVFLDLIRKNQNGLSFRVFDALAFQRKIISSNASIKEYPFYNPNNILVIDPENPEIPRSFFETPFEPLPAELYGKYTIESWVNTVFELEKELKS